MLLLSLSMVIRESVRALFRSNALGRSRYTTASSVIVAWRLWGVLQGVQLGLAVGEDSVGCTTSEGIGIVLSPSDTVVVDLIGDL